MRPFDVYLASRQCELQHYYLWSNKRQSALIGSRLPFVIQDPVVLKERHYSIKSEKKTWETNCSFYKFIVAAWINILIMQYSQASVLPNFHEFKLLLFKSVDLGQLRCFCNIVKTFVQITPMYVYYIICVQLDLWI